MTVYRRVFGPCLDERHEDCGVSYATSDTLSHACSCTCHNKEESGMDFEIKTETKVTGVTVTLTPEMLQWTRQAVECRYETHSSASVFWRRIGDAFEKAKSGE